MRVIIIMNVIAAHDSQSKDTYMNLLDLLNNAGGTQSLGSLADNLGLESSRTNDLVGALAPALLGALQKQTGSENGLSNFKNALQGGGHQQYLSNPNLMSSLETLTDGNNILGHLLGSKETSRQVAAQAAELTGIDVDLIKKALPFIASLTMGAVSKSSDAGNALPDSTSNMFGGLVDGDFDVGDVLDLAKRFF